MSDRSDVVVIGAGQAGFAVSRELGRAGVAHIVLEKGRIAQTWRWDSFYLVTPNWSIQLPGHRYDGQDPDGFMPRDEVGAFLERHAMGFRAPVRGLRRAPEFVAEPGRPIGRQPAGAPE